MKSTLKIDYERGRENYPVIKIVIPNKPPHHTNTPGYGEDSDEDVRDKLIRDFLQTSCYSEPNYFFEVKTTFPIESGHLTTIGAILEDRLFYVFRHAIINRLIAYDSIIEFNADKYNPKTEPETYETWVRINKFFDWLNELKYVDTEEKQPKHEPIGGVTKQNVCNNSKAFHDWLDEFKIEWESDGSFTTVKGEHDVFQLGINFGRYEHARNCNPAK